MAIRIPIITDLQDKGLDEAKRQFGKFKAAIADADGTMGKFKAGSKVAFDAVQANAAMFATAAAAAIGTFVWKSVTAFQDLAIQADKFATSTGISVQNASRIIEVAGDMQIPIDAVETSIGKLNRTIGADPDKVKNLGVDMVYLKDGSIDANETFLNTIQRLKDIKDPAERAKTATELLGKGWRDMSGLIEMGAEELRTSLKNVSEAKVVDPGEVRKAKEFRQTMDDLKDKFEEFALEVGETALPIVLKFLEALVAIMDLMPDDVLRGVKNLVAYGDAALNAGLDAEFLARETEELEEAVSKADTAFENLKGELKLENAVLDAKSMLQDLKEKAVEAFQGADGALGEYEQGLIDAKLKVLDLAEMIALTDSQKNQIRILVDTGELDRALTLIETIGARGYTPELNAMRFRGARASGGPVGSGGTYLVGERGPELFTPGTSGTITPNNALGGGGITVNVNGGDPNQVVAAIQRWVRDNGAVPMTTTSAIRR